MTRIRAQIYIGFYTARNIKRIGYFFLFFKFVSDVFRPHSIARVLLVHAVLLATKLIAAHAIQEQCNSMCNVSYSSLRSP